MNVIKSISIGIFIYYILEMLILTVYKNQINYKKRIDKIRSQNSIGGKKRSFNISLEEKQKGKLLDKLRADLALAEISLKEKEFILISLFIFILTNISGLILNKKAFLTFLVSIGLSMVPTILVGAKKKKNLELFGEQLGEAIMVISNSLRAGFTFEQSLKSISKDLPNPIQREFKNIIQEVELGEKLEQTMYKTAEKMKSDDMNLMTTAVVIQREVGGNLADVLDNIGDTIRQRTVLKKNIKALTAQGEVSGKVIAALPVVLFVLISKVNPEYMKPMTTTTYGYIVLSISAVLEIVGYAVIKKIINIEM